MLRATARLLISRKQAEWTGAGASLKKVATGITGLDVDPNARGTLAALYETTIAEAKAKPNQTNYVKWVQDFSARRLECVKTAVNVHEIEEEINMGQIEELIVNATDELQLLREEVWLTDPESQGKTEEGAQHTDAEFRKQLSAACGFEWKEEWPIEWPPPFDFDAEFKAGTEFVPDIEGEADAAAAVDAIPK
jgi:NADH dehydrogenase (ubiquinone) 1 alpha subcomplex subunit 5